MSNLYRYSIRDITMYEISANSEEEARKKLLANPSEYEAGFGKGEEFNLCECFEDEGFEEEEEGEAVSS